MAKHSKIQPGESIEAWIARQPHAPIVADLRRRLLAIRPALREEVKWSQPWYVLNDNVFYLTCQAGYATLGVCKGATLDDPDHLLEGSGKLMRHVKVRSLSEAASPDLASLIRRAVDQDRQE